MQNLRSWVRGMAAAALLGALSLVGTPAQAAPGDWRPVDDDVAWGEAQVTAVPGTEVQGCVGERTYWQSEAGVVTLIVLDCNSPVTAAGVVRSIALNADFAGAPEVAPVFGAGYDLALTSSGGNLDRYWSQGSRYLGVGASCGARDCAAATARYAGQLAGLVGERINPVWPAPATGPVTGFVPSSGPWMLASDATLPSAQLRVTDCAMAQERQWRDAGGRFAMASVVECGSAELAARAWSDLWINLAVQFADGSVLGQNIDKAAAWQVDATRIGYGRAWVQGTSYAYVHRICPQAEYDACRQAIAADAVALSSLLPGDLVPDNRPLNLALQVVALLFVVPLGTVALLVLPRAAWRLSRERGWAVGPAHPAFTALDAEVRRAQRSRWLRGVVTGVLVLAGYVAGLVVTTVLNNLIAFSLWLFLAPLVLAPAVSGLLRLVWPRHQLAAVARGVRGPASAASVLGAGLRAGAGVMAVLALVGYIVCAVLYLLLNYQTPQLTATMIASLVGSGDPLSFVVGTVFGFVAGLESRGLMLLLFLAVLAGPMTAAYLLDRVGQRLAQRSLQAVLAADTRPHLLYLRGFEEDDLRISPSLARTSFLQWLTPFGRPRFEEVMVRYLSRFGPVIAISGQHGRALPSLGAAKASFADDQWQQKVHEWMGQALTVVVAATPDQVRDGLMWELVQLSDAERHARVVLVVAPWPREQLGSRWQGFLAAACRLPLFAPLALRPFPPAVQVLTYTTDAGWRGYGATRRWDWSYAAALVAAVEDAAPAWERDRLAEQTRLITPDPLHHPGWTGMGPMPATPPQPPNPWLAGPVPPSGQPNPPWRPGSVPPSAGPPPRR